MRIFYLLLISILACQALNAAEQAFDPHKLKSVKGEWKRCEEPEKGEIYYDIEYEKEVVFRILERYLPYFNRLAAQAKENNSKIYFKNNNGSFFASEKEIKKNFYFMPKQKNTTIIAPENIILSSKNKKDQNKSYYFSIRENESIKISVELYKYISCKKSLAQMENKSLAFNLEMLCTQKEINIQALSEIVWLTEKEPSLQVACVACMDNPKALVLMPCKHFCVCEACEEKIEKKNCPICYQQYNATEKIYW